MRLWQMAATFITRGGAQVADENVNPRFVRGTLLKKRCLRPGRRAKASCLHGSAQILGTLRRLPAIQAKRVRPKFRTPKIAPENHRFLKLARALLGFP
jgi:hypothetical protein